MKKFFFIILSTFLLLISTTSSYSGIGIGMIGKKYVLHDLNGSERGKIFIEPSRDALKGTLEFKNFASIAGNFLQQNGFRPVKKKSEADYLVFLNYGLVSDKVYSTEYQYQAGGGKQNIVASVPEYILFPPQRNFLTQNNQKFTRVFEVNMYDIKNDNNHIYQGKIVSKGRCGEIQAVGPDLLKMLFKKFPGKSGKNKTVMSGKSGIC